MLLTRTQVTILHPMNESLCLNNISIVTFIEKRYLNKKIKTQYMTFMMGWLSNISKLMFRIVLFDSFYSWVATCLHLYLAALLDCYIRGQEEWAELRKKYDRSALFHFADTEQTGRNNLEVVTNSFQPPLNSTSHHIRLQ